MNRLWIVSYQLLHEQELWGLGSRAQSMNCLLTVMALGSEMRMAYCSCQTQVLGVVTCIVGQGLGVWGLCRIGRGSGCFPEAPQQCLLWGGKSR